MLHLLLCGIKVLYQRTVCMIWQGNAMYAMLLLLARAAAVGAQQENGTVCRSVVIGAAEVTEVPCAEGEYCGFPALEGNVYNARCAPCLTECEAGYRVSADCPAGFSSKNYCIDVNECAAGVDNCLTGCTNTLGSFTCTSVQAAVTTSASVPVPVTTTAASGGTTPMPLSDIDSAAGGVRATFSMTLLALLPTLGSLSTRVAF